MKDTEFKRYIEILLELFLITVLVMAVYHLVSTLRVFEVGAGIGIDKGEWSDLYYRQKEDSRNVTAYLLLTVCEITGGGLFFEYYLKRKE